MKKLLIALVLGIAATLQAADEVKNAAKNVNAPKTIQTRVGQSFQVTLRSNPTTGYQWKLAEKPDSKVVVCDGNRYEAPPVSNRVGVGGREVWAFKAAGEGTANIRMDYVRPWETNVPPVLTTNIAVVVSPAGK